MNCVNLIRLQPPRHIAENCGAHPGAGKHELPKGLFIEADNARCRSGNDSVGRLHSLEQRHFPEGVSDALRKNLRRIAFGCPPCGLPLHLGARHKIHRKLCREVRSRRRAPLRSARLYQDRQDCLPSSRQRQAPLEDLRRDVAEGTRWMRRLAWSLLMRVRGASCSFPCITTSTLQRAAMY